MRRAVYCAVLSFCLFGCSKSVQEASSVRVQESVDSQVFQEKVTGGTCGSIWGDSIPSEDCSMGENSEKPGNQVQTKVEKYVLGRIDTSEAQQALDSFLAKSGDGIPVFWEFVPEDTDMTARDLEALFLYLSDARIDAEKLEIVDEGGKREACIFMQMREIPENEALSVLRKMIEHASPAVRGYAFYRYFNHYGSKLCLDEQARDTAVAVIKSEDDVYVRSMGLIALGDCLNQYPELIQMAVEDASHALPSRRIAAIKALAPMGKDIPGTVSIFMKLLADSDREVRQTAAHYIGLLESDEVIPALLKLALDPLQRDLHYAVLNSLYTMWYDYPHHKRTSEAAFRATIEYVKTMPGKVAGSIGMNIEAPRFVNALTFESWRKRATYFSGNLLDSYMRALMDIVLNERLDYSTRLSGMDVIKKHEPGRIPELIQALRLQGSSDAKRLMSVK